MSTTTQSVSPSIDKNHTNGSPHHGALPVQKISFNSPFQWLRKGLADITANSLIFGIIMSFSGFMMTYLVIDSGYIFMAIPLIAGFMLVGPFLAVGLYEISRTKNAGESIGLKQAITAMRHNPGQLALTPFA